MRTVPRPDDQIDENDDEPEGESLVGDSADAVSIAVPTATTPTLTPTRIRNIEQDFFDACQVQPPAQHVNQAKFIPPLVKFIPIKAEVNQVNQELVLSIPTSDSVPVSLVQPTIATKRSPPPRMPSQSRKTASARRSQKASDPDDDRRRMRRERNKQAAARCRKRRLDHTVTLEKETEALEEKRQSLQNEVQALQSQKAELEFILQSHDCKLVLKKLKPPMRPNSLALTSTTASRPTSLPLQNLVTASTDLTSSTPSKCLNLFESNWPALTPSTLVAEAMAVDSLSTPNDNSFLPS